MDEQGDNLDQNSMVRVDELEYRYAAGNRQDPGKFVQRILVNVFSFDQLMTSNMTGKKAYQNRVDKHMESLEDYKIQAIIGKFFVMFIVFSLSLSLSNVNTSIFLI